MADERINQTGGPQANWMTEIDRSAETNVFAFRPAATDTDTLAVGRVTERAVADSSANNVQPLTSPTADPSLLEADLQGRRALANYGATPTSAAVSPQTPPEAVITREGTPGTDTERVVITTGAGDDDIQVTRDATTGEIVVSVNGEEHRFTGHDADILKIRAGEGNDSVTVGSGVRVNLTVEGGEGNDTIRGGAGDDRIEGGAGDDTVYGGGGRDYINGSVGNDRLYGQAGNDVLYGGDGEDTLEGGVGTDYLEGSRGNDTLRGGAGRDVLSGGLGDDDLQGGTGIDRLYAGGGIDKIDGGASRDVIYAQTADDTVTNGRGDRVVNVALIGSPGTTSITVTGSAEFVERVEADLEMLRSSPTGRRMLAAHDTAYTASGNNNSLTITELVDEDNGFASTTGANPVLLDASGNRAVGDAVTIQYNTQFNQFAHNPNVAKDAWKDLDPVTVLYHEMAHSYNFVTGTMQDGTYTGTGLDNGVDNSERQAMGLRNTGVRFDHDNDDVNNDGFKDSDPTKRATPRVRDNQRALTENGFREELGRPVAPRYTP